MSELWLCPQCYLHDRASEGCEEKWNCPFRESERKGEDNE